MSTANPDEGTRIVVGVDGSEPSIQALRWAARLAPTLSAQIDAVIAWQYPSYVGWAPAPVESRPDLDAEQALSEAITAAFGETPPAGLHRSVQRGHPAQVLTAAGNGTEMLIVGSRGHGGFTGLLLGSVSAYCAEHAACPVLVVHPTSGTPGRSSARA